MATAGVDRFGGLRPLYGEQVGALALAHVLVVGLGGVGSWVVEALARSGIGALTLMDGDDVCVSNVNRQLHALEGTIGRPKAEVMAERVRAIHPDCRVTARVEFLHPTEVEGLLAGAFDFVVDAIDGLSAKLHLIHGCRQRGVPLVVCGGAGARVDPGQARVADLADSYNDPLLAFVRKRLRQRFGYPPPGRRFGVPCVFSGERPGPRPACATAGPGPVDALFGGDTRLNCEGGLGAAVFVTGTFGLLAAAQVVNTLAGPAVKPG